MNRIQVATFTFNGVPFYSFASGRDEATVAAEAGYICDALTDHLGDGFGFQVRPVDYAHATSHFSEFVESSIAAFHARGERANPAPTAAVVLTPHQADFCGSALEVGADDEDHPESDYQAARELWEKLNQAAELGGSVVLTVEGEKE